MMMQRFDISLASLSDSAIEEIDYNRELKRKLKKDITELGKESALHGIDRMITRPMLIKIIWFSTFE